MNALRPAIIDTIVTLRLHVSTPQDTLNVFVMTDISVTEEATALVSGPIYY